MAKYGKKSQESVKQAMHKFKRGKLASGKSGQKAKSREQAIAIGLSEARKKGAKVPTAPSKKAAPKKSASKSRTTSSRSTAKKSTASRKKAAH